MPSWLPVPSGIDLLDITLVTAFGGLAIRYFRRTSARSALAGLALLGLVYFFARALELRLTATLFQASFAALLLVLVVVFQEDLRRVFEQIGSWGRRSAQDPADLQTSDLLVRVVTRLASTRTGALFVLPGQEPIERHVEGGVGLGGRLSEPLLMSLFDASSPGHDGAVILRGAMVERFAVHLPLSANHAALGGGGTRHAAALGLAERCDAVCIVVSEERGTVSVARDGVMETLARPEDLSSTLRAVMGAGPDPRAWWQDRVGLDLALAAVGALVLWMLLVPGSDVGEKTVAAAISVMNLPNELVLESLDPDVVEVTLRGPRRNLILAERDVVSVRIDAYLARLGRRTFSVSAQDVDKPDALSVVSVTPEKVRLSLKSAAPAESPDDP